MIRINLLGDIGTVDERNRIHRGLLGRLNLDIPLALGLLAVAILGLVVLYSAGRQDMDLLMRQGLRLGLGFLLLIGLAQLPLQHLRLWTPWLYLSGVLLLGAVLVMGEIGK